jgi:3-mercaptopyruvate sulfurtransferase SseA
MKYFALLDSALQALKALPFFVSRLGRLRSSSVATMPRPVLLSAAQLRQMLPEPSPEPQPPISAGPAHAAPAVLLLAVGATPTPPPAVAAHGLWIPTSVYLPTTAIEAGPTAKRPTPVIMTYGDGNLFPADELLAAFTAHGVRRGGSVVVYSAGLHADPLPAARVVWALHWLAPTLGLKALGLLDGGLPGWLAAGFATAAVPRTLPLPPPQEQARAGDTSVAVDTSCLATTEEVLAALLRQQDSHCLLVDVRSSDEYTGASSGEYTYIDTPGRIPTAVWGRWGPSTYEGGDWWSVNAVRLERPPLDNPGSTSGASCGQAAAPAGSGSGGGGGGDGGSGRLDLQVITLLPAPEMRRLWADCAPTSYGASAAGVPAAETETAAGPAARDALPSGGRRIIFYCGSGWRSALAWFIGVAVLDWPLELVANYDGGWLEYSQTHPQAPTHPIELERSAPGL